MSDPFDSINADHVRRLREQIAAREAEVERLRAQLHGCQDGALVRDQAEQIEDMRRRMNLQIDEVHDLSVRYDASLAALKAENVALRERVAQLEQWIDGQNDLSPTR